MQTIAKYLLLSFIIVLTSSSFTTADPPEDDRKFVIMIDPGHGGKDSGTPGTGRYKTTEKDIALDVSLALGKMLEANMPYVEVVYTRQKDIFPSLKGRATAANKADVDLFISIHCNAQPGKKGTAWGSETYVLGLHKSATNLEVAKRENSVIYLEDNYEETYKDFDPSNPESMISQIILQEDYLDQSIELATFIEKEFQVTAKRRSRGVKQAGFWVLAHTYMPSVLVELGFLTHKKEEDFLNSKKGKQVMTKSLYNAVKKYVDMQMSASSDLAYSSDTGTDSEITASNTGEVYDGVTFKVQIAASSRKLEAKSYNFNGLNDISREKTGKIYRYFYGNTSDYTKISTQKTEAIKKGYSTCFIVAFKNGERIPLNQVLKSSSN